MRVHARLAMPAIAAAAAALLLTGCGSDDGGSGGDAGGGFDLGGDQGASEGPGDGGESGDDGPGEPPSFGLDDSEGNPVQFRWESDKTVLVITDEFSVLGDKELDATCPGVGSSGVLGSGPLTFSCPENEINFRTATYKYDEDADTLELTYGDGGTETLNKGEDLRQQELDEQQLLDTLLD